MSYRINFLQLSTKAYLMLITLNEKKTKLRWCGTSGIPVKFRQSTRANRPKRNRKPLDTRVYAAPTQLFLTQIQPLIESVERAHQLLSEASFSSTRALSLRETDIRGSISRQLFIRGFFAMEKSRYIEIQ